MAKLLLFTVLLWINGGLVSRVHSAAAAGSRKAGSLKACTGIPELKEQQLISVAVHHQCEPTLDPA